MTKDGNEYSKIEASQIDEGKGSQNILSSVSHSFEDPYTVASDDTVEYEYPSDPSESDLDLPAGVAFVEESSNVLRAVLDELEFERARRIQLEIQFAELPRKKLEQQQTRLVQDQSEPDEEQNEKDQLRSYQTLQIAHEINSIFVDYESVPKRLLLPVLTNLFSKLFDAAIQDTTCGTGSKTKSRIHIITKNKEKRIKNVINRVYSQCDSSITSKLLRVDYEKETIKPVLETLCLHFVNKLIADTYEAITPNLDYATQKAKNIDLEKQLDAAKLQSEKNAKRHTREKVEYLSLLDSLTSDNDAIIIAAENPSKTLPLHQIRFLEIMPWDDRAQDYISALENVHQWQAFDLRTGMWSDRKIKTNKFFQQLPISKTGNVQNSLDLKLQDSPVKKIQHAFDSFGLNGRILTDACCCRILDLADGYSLPQNAIWEWVSNWALSDNERSTLISPGSDDVEGWVYSKNLKALLPAGGNAGIHYDAQTISRFRRRTWQRQRVLVSYPGISPGTRQMLKMNAHNAKLTLVVSKLHDQVDNMQNKLIQKDEELDKSAMCFMAQITATEAEVNARRNTIKSSRTCDLQHTSYSSSEKIARSASNKATVQDNEKKSKPLLTLHDTNIVLESMTLENKNETSTLTHTADTTQQSSDGEHTTNTHEHSAREEVKEKDNLVNMHIEIEQSNSSDSQNLIETMGWMKSLETMKYNVQTAKDNVQGISGKAQRAMVSLKQPVRLHD